MKKLNKPATKCRIYVWPLETLYIGPIHASGAVVYSGNVICVSLGAPFNIKVGNGPWIKTCLASTPAGVVHEVRSTPSTIIAKYWVEKDSLHNSSLAQFPLVFEKGNFHSKKSIFDTFREIYEKSLNSDDVKNCLNNVFRFAEHEPCKIDSRIQHVSKIIRNEPDYNHSISFLASEVDLSSSRLLHLIKQETGVTYRRYRMWQRIRYVLSIYGLQESLTQSSLESGFSDSAHFTRCFKSFYGTTPSSVLKSLEIYEVDSII